MLSKKKVLLSFLVIFIVILAIAAIAHEDLGEMFRVLAKADYRLVASAFGVYLIFVLLWAERWRVSLAAMGRRVGLRDLYLVVFGSRFINNITPFTYAGGDPISRAYLVNKTQRVPYPLGFASTVVEYVLDFPVFLSFLLIGLFTSIHATSVPTLLLTIVVWMAVVGTIFFTIYSVLKRREIGRLEGLIARVLKLFRKQVSKAKIKSSVDVFCGGFRSVLRRTRSAVWAVVFSALIWMLNVTMLILIFQALGYHPPVPMLLLGITLPAMVGMVPLAPGGLGTVDVTMFSIFLVFMGAANAPLAASAVLLRRLIVFVFATIIGGCALSYLGIRIWKR
jgi:hypothetical protein